MPCLFRLDALAKTAASERAQNVAAVGRAMHQWQGVTRQIPYSPADRRGSDGDAVRNFQGSYRFELQCAGVA